MENLGYEAGLMKTMPGLPSEWSLCASTVISSIKEITVPIWKYSIVLEKFKETTYQLHYSVFFFYFRKCDRKVIYLSRTSFSSSMVHTIIWFPYLNENNFLSLVNFCWPLLLWCKLSIYSQILVFPFPCTATVYAPGQCLAPSNKRSLTLQPVSLIICNLQNMKVIQAVSGWTFTT